MSANPAGAVAEITPGRPAGRPRLRELPGISALQPGGGLG